MRGLAQAGPFVLRTMTSEELKRMTGTDLSTNGWLRELCIQLALLNEKQTIMPTQPKPAPKR
jgi:hypothetical protein